MIRPLRKRRHCGYLLVEMLVIIGIMSIAIFVEVKLYRATMGIINSEPQNQKNLIAIDQLVQWLREDVWEAQRMSAADGKSVMLEYPENRKIQWNFTEREVIRSEQSADSQPLTRTYSLPMRLLVRAEGPRLVLSTDADANSPSEQIFISQLMISGGTR